MPRVTGNVESVFVVGDRFQFLSQEPSVSQGSASVASTLKYCRILRYLRNTECKWVTFWLPVYHGMPEKTSFHSSWVIGESGIILLSGGVKAFCDRASACPALIAGREGRPPGGAVGGLGPVRYGTWGPHWRPLAVLTRRALSTFPLLPEQDGELPRREFEFGFLYLWL